MHAVVRECYVRCFPLSSGEQDQTDELQLDLKVRDLMFLLHTRASHDVLRDSEMLWLDDARRS